MNTRKKTLALLLCAAMTLPAFACSFQNIDPAEDESSTVSDAANDSTEESNGAEGDSSASDGSGDSSAADVIAENVVTDQYGQKNQKLSFQQPSIEDDTPLVTSRRAQDGNIYVNKTDLNGAIVTDADGSAETEIYTGETNAAEYEPDYTPSIKSYQAIWLDISERADYIFDGNLLEFEVEVAQDAPDGIYPVEVYYADFSNYSANTDENASVMKNAAFRAGYLCINSEKPEVAALGTAMTLTPDTVSAKPGETVRMNVRIDNNTGIVAFVIRMHYDDKVMTIVNAGAGEDLASRASLTATAIS